MGANRILQILATDRHMSHRLVTGSKDAAPVPLIHGRFGYGVPKAKRNSIALDEVEDNIADYLPAAAYSSVLEEGAASHPQPAAARGIQGPLLFGVLYSSSWGCAWVGSWVWRCWVVGRRSWVCLLRRLRLRDFESLGF